MLEKLKGLLIDDWKRSWRLLTVWLTVALGVIEAAGEILPQMREYLPEGWVKYMAIAILLARLLKQKKWRGPQ